MENLNQYQNCIVSELSELQKVVSDPSMSPTQSLLKIKTANEWTTAAAQRPDPKSLWMSFWYEGELCCLFADSNLGKSIYAVEIARSISRTEPVIYFDFELSDKQFQLRYTDESGILNLFPSNFLRAEIDSQSICMEGLNVEEKVISDIENAALKYGANKLIIDNLSFLCNSADKSDMAGRLMLRLLDLKKRHNLSILVLAHTPKRSLTSPITQNDLAGSKKLFNFFDSVFAIGKSAKDEGLRYIKQLKVRAGAFEYGGDNVIVSEIIKDGNWLHFKNIGNAPEKEHLQSCDDKEKASMKNSVIDLYKEGKSYSEIASLMGISKSTVCRIVKS